MACPHGGDRFAPWSIGSIVRERRRAYEEGRVPHPIHLTPGILRQLEEMMPDARSGLPIYRLGVPASILGIPVCPGNASLGV
jgi:hypothetical protein